MKRLKWIALSLVLLIIVVIGIVLLRLDSIVRYAVETQSSDSLGLTTTLDSANISLLGGTVKLSGLSIASPAGFSSPQMVSLGGIGVGASVGELRGDPVAVQTITIDKPKLVIEQANGKFNFQVLTDQKSKTPPDSGKPGDGTRQEGEPVRLIIHDLTVNDSQVVIRPGIPGLAESININIPSFTMKEIGNADNNKNGAAIKEVVTLLVTTLAQKASESKDIPPELRQILTLNVDQVKEKVAGEITKQLGKITKDLPPDATKQIESQVQKGLGDLLGGKKESPTTKPK